MIRTRGNGRLRRLLNGRGADNEGDATFSYDERRESVCVCVCVRVSIASSRFTLNDDLDAGLGAPALVHCPTDVRAGVLAAQRFDRQRGGKVVDEPDAHRVASVQRVAREARLVLLMPAAGQQLAVFRPSQAEWQSALHDGALKRQTLAGVHYRRLGHRHYVRAV